MKKAKSRFGADRVRRPAIAAGWVLTLVSAAWANVPRFIADLDVGGIVRSPQVSGTVVTMTAGPIFADLTDASKAEVCQIVRDYYAGATGGVMALQIVDGTGQVVFSCGS